MYPNRTKDIIGLTQIQDLAYIPYIIFVFFIIHIIHLSRYLICHLRFENDIFTIQKHVVFAS